MPYTPTAEEIAELAALQAADKLARVKALKKKTKKKRKAKPSAVMARYKFNKPENVIKTFPQTKTVKMFYRGSFAVPQVANNPCGSRAVRMNSIRDPDQYPGVGHSPLGYDQMKLYYNNMTVIRSTIKATFYSKSAASEPYYAGLGLDRDTTLHAVGSLDGQIEHQLGRNVKLCLTNTREKAVLRGTYDIKRFFPEKQDRDDQTVAVDAEPTKQVYCNCWVGAPNALTAAPICDFEVTYLVVFSEPKGMASS